MISTISIIMKAQEELWVVSCLQHAPFRNTISRETNFFMLEYLIK